MADRFLSPAAAGSAQANQRRVSAVSNWPVPGRAVRETSGVLLRDPDERAGICEDARALEEIEDPEEAEVAGGAGAGFRTEDPRDGRREFLRSLEDSLSNTLRLTERVAVTVDDFPRTLDSAVRRARGSRPVAALRDAPAALFAGGRGDKIRRGSGSGSRGLGEGPGAGCGSPQICSWRAWWAGRWSRASPTAACACFARAWWARGRASWCWWSVSARPKPARATPSRNTPARKRQADEGEWEHASVRLEPLNPEFEGFDAERRRSARDRRVRSGAGVNAGKSPRQEAKGKRQKAKAGLLALRPRSSSGMSASGATCPGAPPRDPYRILVSEVMLQQTRAQAVIPYYQRFLERFPDAQALAAARGSRRAGLLERAGILFAGAQSAARRRARSPAAGSFPGRLRCDPRAARRGTVHGRGRGQHRVR